MLSVAEKITLFRQLFRGREDVYPRRFENRKTQKSGYAPACGKDFVLGVYPMLLDETCFFLAVDFDKTHFQRDAMAFFMMCRQKQLPAVLERSRSGNGAHVWLFFEEAIPATTARRLGAYLLTETMEHHPDIGLDSYDRLFPNQDTLPQGGFGNLIALPLQKAARQNGNSVFVDDDWAPHADQWDYLSGIQKISRLDVESIVAAAELKGRVLGIKIDLEEEDNPTPWKKLSNKSLAVIPSSELPEKLDLVVSNEIYIAKSSLSAPLKNKLIRMAAFQNLEFYKAQAMRLPVYDKPRIIGCAHDYSEHIGLPRGCLDELLESLKSLKIEPSIVDETQSGMPIEVSFCGTLRNEQVAAAQAMLDKDIGVLAATTAFGKTVIAAWLIAQRGVNTLILVHRKQLQSQWVERLSTFLDIPKKTIGRLGGSRKKITGFIDVALIQSMVRNESMEEILSQYGHVIIDECHHLPAVGFESVARQVRAKFMTGLSATVKRKDGHHPIITMRCGPIRYRVNALEQAKIRPFEHKIFVRPTAFIPNRVLEGDLRLQFQDLYKDLISCVKRNQQIVDDVLYAVNQGRSPIVLTERNEHLDYLYQALKDDVQHVIVLRGGMGQKSISAMEEQLKVTQHEDSRVLLATGKFVGEGFDDARLDTLFLTLPISWSGTVAQYAGRLHRLYDTKKEVQVYDYADFSVPMLERMFNRRVKAYESIGYHISHPASAIAGWPVEVMLPSDPVWKMDYTTSIKRLVRDGVDAQLAHLFMQSTVQASTIDFSRARSVVEAFLYYRLETLSETVGRFELNGILPIPFDNAGNMEIDLLCRDKKIAVEIDGLHHLDCKEAYRRDRRKDLLLQEQGYLVIRFLAEDIGKRLDEVLETLIRALLRRR